MKNITFPVTLANALFIVLPIVVVIIGFIVMIASVAIISKAVKNNSKKSTKDDVNYSQEKTIRERPQSTTQNNVSSEIAQNSPKPEENKSHKKGMAGGLVMLILPFMLAFPIAVFDFFLYFEDQDTKFPIGNPKTELAITIALTILWLVLAFIGVRKADRAQKERGIFRFAGIIFSAEILLAIGVSFAILCMYNEKVKEFAKNAIYVFVLILIIVIWVNAKRNKKPKQPKKQVRNTADTVWYDSNGRIDRIGNNQVWYDSSGKISRVGSETVWYDSNGRIDRIGNETVWYGSDGRINRIGNRTVWYDSNGRIDRIE